MGMGDTPIGDAPGDYPTGIPALDEVPRHGRLLGYLLRRSPSFLRRRKPDHCPPLTYHPIALQWSCRPKELHSQQKLMLYYESLHPIEHQFTMFKQLALLRNRLVNVGR